MKCIDCRFWSEMIAQNRGYDVEAMCLCDESPFKGKMMLETDGCKFGKVKIFDSIDVPGAIEMYYNEEEIAF
jgi:hypothetical protein